MQREQAGEAIVRLPEAPLSEAIRAPIQIVALQLALKLTAVVYVPSPAVAAALAVRGGVARRLWSVAVLVLGGVLGFALVYGPWGWITGGRRRDVRVFPRPFHWWPRRPFGRCHRVDSWGCMGMDLGVESCAGPGQP